jgi:hypothetical protein
MNSFICHTGGAASGFEDGARHGKVSPISDFDNVFGVTDGIGIDDSFSGCTDVDVTAGVGVIAGVGITTGVNVTAGVAFVGKKVEFLKFQVPL